MIRPELSHLAQLCMNNIKYLTIVTVLMLASVNLVVAQTPSAHLQILSANNEGQVQFNVLMPNDVLIPNLSVVIESHELRKEIELNADRLDAKENLVILPVGIYRLSSRTGNYYDFKRAPFRVEAGRVSRVNVFPLIRVRTQMLMADGRDRYDIAPAPKYDSFPVPNSADAALILMIRYDEKRPIRDSLTYSGKVREFRGDPQPVFRGVMVTYDGLSLYADTVRFDPLHFLIYANGNVVIENGGQRQHVDQLVIEFKNGVAEIGFNR